MTAPQTVRAEEPYYTPGRVDHWLCRWAELTARAEAVGAIRVHLPWEGGPDSDPLRWAVVKADLESAWNALHPTTREYRLVYLVMQGVVVMENDRPRPAWRELEDLLHMRHSTAGEVYHRAVRIMSERLGGKA